MMELWSERRRSCRRGGGGGGSVGGVGDAYIDFGTRGKRVTDTRRRGVANEFL